MEPYRANWRIWKRISAEPFENLKTEYEKRDIITIDEYNNVSMPTDIGATTMSEWKNLRSGIHLRQTVQYAPSNKIKREDLTLKSMVLRMSIDSDARKISL